MDSNLYYLEGLLDNGKRWRVHLDSFPFLVGRGTHCNLTISSADVSREHIKFFLSKDELFIEDCNSTNGTLLNDKKIDKRIRLFEDDIIDICGLKYKFIHVKEESDKTIINIRVAPGLTFATKYGLTPRETELISYLIKGISTKEIAKSMFISPGTAKNHILNLLKKTNTHNRVELITAYNSTVKGTL